MLMAEKTLPFTKKDLESILEIYPTFYIYYVPGIRNTARRLNNAFSWVDFKNYFAVKACSNPYILDILKEETFAEMRDKKSKFINVKEVVAATGVKISAPDLNNVVAGMPIRSTTKDELEKTKEEIQREIEEVLIETDRQGIVIKADTLGSLEALIQLLREKGIKIRSASIGNISKKDISDAESNYEKNPLDSVILGFNVSLCQDVIRKDTVQIILNNVIYKLIEDFEKWQEHEKKMIEAKEIEALSRPCKIEFLKNYVFRQSNPAVFGVDVLIGVLKTNNSLMKEDSKVLGSVKGIQSENENVNRAEQGKQVAISMDHVTIGRQINEGDTLYSAIPEEDFRKMKKLTKYLSREEIILLKQIADIMRKNNPVWGI